MNRLEALFAMLTTFILGMAFQGCSLSGSNYGAPQGAPALDASTVSDGQGTPSTDLGLQPTDVDVKVSDQWGNSDANTFRRIDQDLVLSGNGRAFTVYQGEDSLTPEGRLSVLADFMTDDPNVDTLFTLGVEGTDADGKPFFHGVRLRSQGTEAIYQGAHGAETRRLQYSVSQGVFHRMELVFYRNGTALYLSSAGGHRLNPNHVFYFPVVNGEQFAQGRFVAKILRGSGVLKNLRLSRASPKEKIAQLPAIRDGGRPLTTDGRLKTLTTRQVDLSQTWSGYSSGADPIHFLTTFDNAPAELFTGTTYEWSRGISKGAS